MQNYELTLRSPVSKTFRCQKAANSLDIDTAKKSVHEFRVEADIETDFNLGLVVGASGSGKTSFAQHVWGEECFKTLLDLDTPVIDQLPEHLNYDECANILNGIGLTQVPCWIRPAHTLSNGQRCRAEIALQMARIEDASSVVVIDEWTSVVDRTVAKVMSHCIQKHARRTGKRVVLLSCHYDVIDWLNPDWVIDCNQRAFVDRRLLWRDFKRTETLDFTIAKCHRSTWSTFSRYHYLSDRLPAGRIETFGVYHGGNQIGFQCFANYTPRRAGTTMKMHSNRTVIHPDYAGFGLGIQVINLTSEMMHRAGYECWAKFSSVPVYKAMRRQACWEFVEEQRKFKTIVGGNMRRETGFRSKVRTFTFRYIPQPALEVADNACDYSEKRPNDRAVQHQR